VFARFARDMFAKSVRFARRFSVFYMHLTVFVFARFARDTFASLTDLLFSVADFSFCCAFFCFSAILRFMFSIRGFL
ncbi:hypothetical protein J5839_02440, partial [Methanosarcinaceae archaeon]|nr:hypothetical protein [Methanosarcinaceae archaeon]